MEALAKPTIPMLRVHGRRPTSLAPTRHRMIRRPPMSTPRASATYALLRPPPRVQQKLWPSSERQRLQPWPRPQLRPWLCPWRGRGHGHGRGCGTGCSRGRSRDSSLLGTPLLPHRLLTQGCVHHFSNFFYARRVGWRGFFSTLERDNNIILCYILYV